MTSEKSDPKNNNRYYTRIIPAQEGLKKDVVINELIDLIEAFEIALLLETPEEHPRGGYTLHFSINAALVEKFMVY
ncbi:MAG: hypothetical protein AAF629_12205, partial [Chloroflexota bacterium]